MLQVNEIHRCTYYTYIYTYINALIVHIHTYSVSHSAWSDGGVYIYIVCTILNLLVVRMYSAIPVYVASD